MGGTFTVAGIIDSCIFSGSCWSSSHISIAAEDVFHSCWPLFFSATEIFKKFELGKLNWEGKKFCCWQFVHIAISSSLLTLQSLTFVLAINRIWMCYPPSLGTAQCSLYWLHNSCTCSTMNLWTSSSQKLGKIQGQSIDIATLQRNHSVPSQALKPHVFQQVLKEFV